MRLDTRSSRMQAQPKCPRGLSSSEAIPPFDHKLLDYAPLFRCTITLAHLDVFVKPLDSIGGDERARTAGLLRAREALSQLSYIPPDSGPTSSMSDWWAFLDLNQRPHPYQRCALAD
jgi:hypothetical protein